MHTLAHVHRYSIIGSRIEMPVHYDAWMRGAQYGVITSMRHGRSGLSAYAYVKLDRQRKRAKLWQPDFAYARLIRLPTGGALLGE